MKALVFEPHDDDLIIGMGGVALKMMENGWEFKTVQMTDGRHGSDEIDPEELVEIRREEKEAEIEYLGIDCDFLEYEDGKLWDEMQKNREEVISEIKEVLREYRPDAVFMPARDEGHPDHRATNLLATRALHQIDPEPLKASYLVWNLPFMDGENLAEKVLGTEVEEVYDEKLEALRLHESQIREGRYDEMIEKFNSYLGLLYSSYKDKIGRSEVLGIQNPGKSEIVEDLGFKDVTDLSHGRSTEEISLEK